MHSSMQNRLKSLLSHRLLPRQRQHRSQKRNILIYQQISKLAKKQRYKLAKTQTSKLAKLQTSKLANDKRKDKIRDLPQRRQHLSNSVACSPNTTKRPCSTARDRRFLFCEQEINLLVC